MKSSLVGFWLAASIVLGGVGQLFADTSGSDLFPGSHSDKLLNLASSQGEFAHSLFYAKSEPTSGNDSEGVLEEKEEEEREEQDGKSHHEFELFSCRGDHPSPEAVSIKRLPFRLYLLQGVLRI